MKPSTPRARDSRRSAASASQLVARSRPARAAVARDRSAVGRDPRRRAPPRAARAARAAAARARSTPCQLEQVVGDEADRRVGEHLLRQRLAADALLQQGERRDATVLPDDDLAVEHGAVGQRAAAATISGKRSVTSSSPRDQIQTCAARLTTCARMPSYFHSTIQSGGRAEPGRELVFERRSSWWARKNGYGWPRSSGPASSLDAVSCAVALRRSASRGRRCSPSCAARRAWRRRPRPRRARAAPAAC